MCDLRMIYGQGQRDLGSSGQSLLVTDRDSDHGRRGFSPVAADEYQAAMIAWALRRLASACRRLDLRAFRVEYAAQRRRRCHLCERDALRPTRKNLDRHPNYILAAYMASGR